MDELTKPRYQIYYNQKPLAPQVFSDLHVQYQYGSMYHISGNRTDL